MSGHGAEALDEMVSIVDKVLPGHGRMKEVRVTANRFSLQAEVD